MPRVLVIVMFLATTACMSTSYSTKVRVRDVEKVEIVHDDQGDIALADSGIFDGPRTVIQRTPNKPDHLPTRNARYTWRKGKVVASTPADNIEAARLLTHWNQPYGEGPPILWTLLGGVSALGFGVAGPSIIVDATSKEPVETDRVVLGSVLSGLAVGGLALATYGVVTWTLVNVGTTESPLPVE